MAERVLISTLSAEWGGVISMLEFATQTMVANDYEPVLAYYEPFRQAPDLSVPSYRLGTRWPGHRKTSAPGGFEAHAIGAWLPELEFTHYQATRHWRDIMASCSRFIGISGNIMVSTPFLQTGRDYLSWVATGWEEDRKDRVRLFGPGRSLLDRIINAPRLRALEARLIRSGKILALSEHTRNVLNAIAERTACEQVLPMPIDCDIFQPAPRRVGKGRVGFSGRLDDPRKNVELLLQAGGQLLTRTHDFEIVLIGGALPRTTERLLQELGLGARVRIMNSMSREDLAQVLQSLDVFVVPSHQEGLCISALEAMASGCPVVSTRCGGPTEFVRDDCTGHLVGFDAVEMAEVILRIISNREHRATLAANARDLVERHYNRARCETILLRALRSFDDSQSTCRLSAGFEDVH